MSTTEILRKLKLYEKNPELVKELSNNELASLVLVVMGAVRTIDDAIKSGKLDIETKLGADIKKYSDDSKKTNEQLVVAVRDEVTRLVEQGTTQLSETSSALEKRVAEAIENIRDGEDGIVSDEDIARAAQIAAELVELPDFEELAATSITAQPYAVRDSLELITEEDEKLAQSAISGLLDTIEELRKEITQSKGMSGGGVSQARVLQLIAENAGSGSGDMTKAVYDPAAKEEQVLTTSDIDDTAYGVSWDGVTDVAPSKNAVYDKIETLAGGHDPVTVTDSAEIDFTLTGQDLTASLIAGSIDETKLDTSVNASLDLADSASQPGHTHAASDVTSGTFDDARIAESNVTQHEAAISITESQISDLGNYEIKAVANGSLTAALDTYYVCVSNSTFTDPSPVEGEGFAVFVRNGTATVGGTGYSTAGTIIHRIFHSGAWANYVYHTSTAFAATLLDDADAATARTTLDVDQAGTDNSTDVTLAGTPDYITIAGQVITRNLIDLTTDVTGVLPEANLPDASTTAQGVVELATTAEVDTGTDTTRAITPDALNGSSPDFVLVGYDAARGKVTAGGNLGATETINFNSETNYTGTLDSNITFTFANATSGDDVTLYLSYDGTAQRTITWPTVTWLDNATGAAPATPSASGNVLVVTVRYIGSTFYASATGNYSVYA